MLQIYSVKVNGHVVQIYSVKVIRSYGADL